uniref:Anaphase-promoting complex subunit 1 n=1 Tax=Angiostrongylus costaricensis TaxID=334426 RepID=A0A158PF65_ANGCS
LGVSSPQFNTCFQIGKSLRADEEPSTELPAYKLSAGFAIGLICLGLGEGLFVWKPPFKQPLPSIPDRLRTLMIGGPRIFLNLRFLQREFLLVQEGTNVNVHMTAHPATIALGLMYMRTGNLEIARDLELPATISMLEEIRPDVIFVRVVARSLVLWDMIEPTCAWIDKQIPNIIHEYALAVLKFPSNIEVNITDKEQAYWDEVVDKETVAEVYLYAMTAACFVMALKFSGIIGDRYEDILKILVRTTFLFPTNYFTLHSFNSVFLRYGFKKDNLSIALLVISMYPIVAHHVADNRLYHQPLRFLWTHAVEPRLLVPTCRKKNKPIQCDLEIQFKVGQTVFFMVYFFILSVNFVKQCLQVYGASQVDMKL